MERIGGQRCFHADEHIIRKDLYRMVLGYHYSDDGCLVGYARFRATARHLSFAWGFLSFENSMKCLIFLRISNIILTDRAHLMSVRVIKFCLA